MLYLLSLVLASIGLLFGGIGFAGAQSSAVCLECHEDMSETLMGSPHEIGSADHLKSPVTAECQSCHTDFEQHLEDPMPENISRGTDLQPFEQSKMCTGCHITPHQKSMSATDPHMKAGLGCFSCHSIHNNQTSFLTHDDMENYCIECHQSVALEFERRSAHPLGSGNIRCTDCHDLSAAKIAEENVGFDWTCQGCHDEMSGPHLYEHPITLSYLVDGGGCVECHEPHGSTQERLLNLPGNQVCMQCHATPPAHMSMHSGLGTRFACVDCHTEIHGSFDNNKFLDPDLGTKLFPDCYQSGCHIVND